MHYVYFISVAFIIDPFRCGQVHPKKTRSNLYHVENSHPENTTGTSNSSGKANGVDSTAKNSEKLIPKNSTHSAFDDLFGLDMDIEKLITPVTEEPILSEIAGDTRIVNGEECLPGDCPWQVETSFFLCHYNVSSSVNLT